MNAVETIGQRGENIQLSGAFFARLGKLLMFH
jgi:hypothetical protein